jgi:hypothetical protein
MARGNEMTTTKMVEFRKDRMVVYKGKTYNPCELVELPVEDVEYLLAKKLVTEKNVSKK